MSATLTAKHFHDEMAAYAFVEARVWPNGPICPHCGGFDRVGKLKGKSTRIGVYKCYQCRKPFSVKTQRLESYTQLILLRNQGNPLLQGWH